MAIEDEALAFSQAAVARLMELLVAPLSNNEMLWAAIPLLIATLFMTLYFGRNRKEELGWNTAFGNTMVFLFVAINLIKQMYGQEGSWAHVFENKLYLTLSIGLAGASIILMLLTYFHLLPKRLAFFLFSAPPINVSVYVVMSIVYADVPPDWLTISAGVLFLILIIIAAWVLQALVRLVGLEDRGEERKAKRGYDEGRMEEIVDEELDSGESKMPSPPSKRAPPPFRKSASGKPPR